MPMTLESEPLQNLCNITRSDEFIILDTDLFAEPSCYYKIVEPAKTVVYIRAKGKLPRNISIQLIDEHPLWAHQLWNASKCLAKYIDDHAELVKNLKVLELGAGGALPTIIAALNQADLAIATDYPDSKILENIKTNLHENYKNDNVSVEGHKWGSDTNSLLKLTNNTGYDTLILSDIVFNHSQNPALAKSCAALLAKTESARCLVFFSHHRPWLAECDNQFFEFASNEGLISKKIVEEFVGPMYENDAGPASIRGTVHGYEMLWNSQLINIQ